MSHTSGPWAVDGDDIVGRRHIARLADWHIVEGTVKYKVIEDALKAERQANARLIAAAPDMLAALEMVNDMLPDMPQFMWNKLGGDSSPAYIIKLAIAKAKGEA